MKKFRLALLACVFVAAAPAAFAQTDPVGQDKTGAINQTAFSANSDSAGFNQMSLTPALVVPSTATTYLLATLITTKTTHITTCSSTTGVRLPALQRFERIQLINRSGGTCLVFPSIGATLETALGTDAAANIKFDMLTNTNIAFCPITATRWVQCQ